MTTDSLAAIKAKHEEVAAAEARVQKLSAERSQLIQNARNNGTTAQAIANTLGVSRPRVYQLADKKYR